MIFVLVLLLINDICIGIVFWWFLMNKEILTQFKTYLSKIGLDAQNVEKRDPARASLKQKWKKNKPDDFS